MRRGEKGRDCGAGQGCRQDGVLDSSNFWGCHMKPVKAWATERQDKIEFFYSPSYGSEQNPQGRLLPIV